MVVQRFERVFVISQSTLPSGWCDETAMGDSVLADRRSAGAGSQLASRSRRCRARQSAGRRSVARHWWFQVLRGLTPGCSEAPASLRVAWAQGWVAPSDTNVMSRVIQDSPNLLQGSGCFVFRGLVGPPGGSPVPW